MAAAEKLHYWWACVNISLAVELLVDRGISTVLYGITEVRIIIWKCCRHFGGYWLHVLVMLAVLRSSRVSMDSAFRLMVSRIVVLFSRWTSSFGSLSASHP